MIEKTTIERDLTTIRKRCVEYVENTSRPHEFHSYDLGGMCGSASLIISKFYEDRGVNVDIHEGEYGKHDENHCWVKIGDYFGDITASQFGLRDVIVRKKSIGRTKKIIKGTLKEKFKEMDNDGWDRTQLLWPFEITRIVKGIKL